MGRAVEGAGQWISPVRLRRFPVDNRGAVDHRKTGLSTDLGQPRAVDHTYHCPCWIFSFSCPEKTGNLLQTIEALYTGSGCVSPAGGSAQR